MKKIIFILAISLLCTMQVFAGDVPEGLLSGDKAQVFFAEVAGYNEGENSIAVKPVRKIKGDVNVGSGQIYYDPYAVGGFIPQEGEVYLFTYYDQYNPTYIFETTGTETATLQLKHHDGDMWKRFEEYLNAGRYEAAEQKRLERLQDTGAAVSSSAAENVESTEETAVPAGSWMTGAAIAAAIFASVFLI